MVSAIMTTACCLSEDWLVARAATITWWAQSHHRLAGVGLLEVPSARRRHDAGLSSGEIALGLVVGHPRMGLTFDLGQLLRQLRRQLRFFLFHPLITHRLVLRYVGPDLGAVQRHVAQLHQPRPLAKRQHLQKQTRQRRQVVLAKVGDGAEVWGVIRRQHPKGDVLVEALGDAP